jgi:hypothetical protein
MSYLDFDLEIEEGSGGRDYRVVARSAAGDTRAVMRFPYDELAPSRPPKPKRTG